MSVLWKFPDWHPGHLKPLPIHTADTSWAVQVPLHSLAFVSTWPWPLLPILCYCFTLFKVPKQVLDREKLPLLSSIRWSSCCCCSPSRRWLLGLLPHIGVSMLQLKMQLQLGRHTCTSFNQANMATNSSEEAVANTSNASYIRVCAAVFPAICSQAS